LFVSLPRHPVPSRPAIEPLPPDPYDAPIELQKALRVCTFDFLGLTHICARSRRGKFTVHVRTMRKRLRRSLTAVGEWCQQHRHMPVDEQQKTLNAKLRGHYQYYGRPTNSQSLLKFYRGVVRIWRKWLNRRTRGNRMTWERYKQLLRRYSLLSPQISHPWAYSESPA
jgi:RNA-directed DNA polymerase